MEKLTTILQVIVPIFVAVVLGMVARKKKTFSSEEIQGMQDFVVKICLPCVIFRSCLTADFGPQTLSSMAMLLPFLLVSTFWSFRQGKKHFPYHNLPMLLCCKETGMMGIPLFMILFGAEQAFHMAALDLTQAVIVFPVMGILSADTREAASFREIVGHMLRSPMILLSILGVFLNLTGIWDLLERTVISPVLLETLSFFSQPVSLIMLFCVGYNFSLRGENRKAVMKLSAAHFGYFMLIQLVIQGILLLVPDVAPITRWAVLLYCLLPTSYLAPGLGKSGEDYTVASGACSVLTVVCLAAFVCMVVIGV